MLMDDNERQPLLSEFLVSAEILRAKSEDCLNHLHLIKNDEEAIQCLLGSLLKLANLSYNQAINPLGEFTQSVHEVLYQARKSIDLDQPTLQALKDCLTLIAWQLELIDPLSGELNMDGSEQHVLLETLTSSIDQHRQPPSLVATPREMVSTNKRTI